MEDASPSKFLKIQQCSGNFMCIGMYLPKHYFSIVIFGMYIHTALEITLLCDSRNEMDKTSRLTF